MPVLSQEPFLVCDHTCCVRGCGRAGGLLFTLEESEKPGSPILKLTGPFGSNNQMCHGKKAPCHTARDAKPLPASIFSFKAGNWCQCDWVFTYINFFPDNSTGVSPLGAAEWQKMNDNLFISSDTLRRAKVRCGRQTDKKRRGWVLSASPF